MYRREGPPLVGVLVVRDGDLDIDRHAADRVDDLLEALEVDLDEVLDVEPVQLPEDRLEAVVAAGAVPAREEVLADRTAPNQLLILPAYTLPKSGRAGRSGWARPPRRAGG